MIGKKPNKVKGFVIVREFRGTNIYLVSVHSGHGMRWHTDRDQAMSFSDAQEALNVAERGSREWGAKCLVIDSNDAPHVVAKGDIRPVCRGSLLWPTFSASTNTFFCRNCGHNFTRDQLEGRDDHMPTHYAQTQSL